MGKKSLLFVLALLVAGLSVIQAQTDEQKRQLLELMGMFENDGNPSGGNVEEYVPRGATKGWPTNSIFDRQATFRLTPPTINTPYGITTSYEIEDASTMNLYISRNYLDNNLNTADWSNSDIQWFVNYLRQGTGAAFTNTVGSQYEGTTARNAGYITRIELIPGNPHMTIKLTKTYMLGGN